MDIIISLNITPTSPEGLRVCYLSKCLEQLNNLYQIVDSSSYKNSLNSCLGLMSFYILSENITEAIQTFDTLISSIQTLKSEFFTEYGNWFMNQYTPPV